jgi:hypothetical protein
MDGIIPSLNVNMICPTPGHPTQKDTVLRGMSKLDDNITQSGSMLEETRDDIWISIAHSKEVKKSVVRFAPPPVPHSTLQHHLKIKLVKFLRLFQHVIGHGIVGKDIPIMARLAKARRWSKR